jgi:hypothetical protein
MHTRKTTQINHNECVSYGIKCNFNDIFDEFIFQQKSVVSPPILNLKQVALLLNLKWGNMQMIFVIKLIIKNIN